MVWLAGALTVACLAVGLLHVVRLLVLRADVIGEVSHAAMAVGMAAMFSPLGDPVPCGRSSSWPAAPGSSPSHCGREPWQAMLGTTSSAAARCCSCWSSVIRTHPVPEGPSMPVTSATAADPTVGWGSVR